MSTTQPPPDSHTNPLTQMLQSVFSDNSNIMLAAIISLLLVILFVLLLHLYAKWFLAHAHAQSQSRRPPSVTVSDVIGPARFHHFHTFNLQDSPISHSPTKGLDSASISAIPVFVYEAENTLNQEADERDLECVICLSIFENGETGRSLPKCCHAFHVECIDMWLSSHSNCPICRAPIGELDSQFGSVLEDDSSSVLEIVINNSPSSEIISENADGGTESINISTNNDNDQGGVSVSVISISETTSSSLLGCSLKRMFSTVFPSSNVTELGTS
ncbi:hypothetical protein K1719_019864 [Acacia pycnantha]|nr:hypothetical protein K1719_019864 [Acacia pycnantha]